MLEYTVLEAMLVYSVLLLIATAFLVVRYK